MRPEDLGTDGRYFLVTYHDKDLRLPEIATYVYVGKDIFGPTVASGETRWFFQTAESRATDGLFNPKVHEPAERLLAVGSDMIDEFCSVGQLIEILRGLDMPFGRRG